MKARRLASAILAAGGMLTLAALPASADQTLGIDPCDLRKTIYQLQNYGDDTSKNIIVFNTKVHQSSRFEKIVREGTLSANPCGHVWFDDDTYRWVVFSGKGEFVRKGDGGYRNWAFSGKWTRPEDKKVIFHAR